MAKKQQGKNSKAAPVPEKRAYLSQTDVPLVSLQEASRIPRALADQFAKRPTKPMRVAEAVGLSPGSSRFRDLCGASIAYGLTSGGCNADNISLEDLGRRIVAPTIEGDDEAARRQAILKPRIFGDFLGRYNNSKLPTERIAQNVLEELGVPADRTAKTYEMIKSAGLDLGLIREVKGAPWVDLDGVATEVRGVVDDIGLTAGTSSDALDTGSITELGVNGHGAISKPVGLRPTDTKNERVFVTHGKNRAMVEQIKKLLTYGKFEPIVSVERETVSKPVSSKVLGDMRTCHAAVIHVSVEKTLVDAKGDQHAVLNDNVLIEIGAAMALFEERFILLVAEGTELPSNLQGLYQVRYKGDELDYNATMKLLEAFNEFRVQ